MTTTSIVDPNDIAILAGKDLTDSELAALTLTLEDISAEVRSVTGRSFAQATSTVNLPGVAWRGLHLPDPPISHVASVALDGYTITDFWQTRDLLIRGVVPTLPVDDDWPYVAEADPLTLGWGGPDHTVTVTYTHGGAAPPGVVAIIRRVALNTIDAPTGQVRSETMGAYSVSYAAGGPNDGAWLTADDRRRLRRMCGNGAGTFAGRM